MLVVCRSLSSIGTIGNLYWYIVTYGNPSFLPSNVGCELIARPQNPGSACHFSTVLRKNEFPALSNVSHSHFLTSLIRICSMSLAKIQKYEKLWHTQSHIEIVLLEELNKAKD